MRMSFLLLSLASFTVLPGCATDLGTGRDVVVELEGYYPTTVGMLVKSHMDTSSRLRIYLQICEDVSPDGVSCVGRDQRMLAMVEAERKSVLRRLAERYLDEGREYPVYVYGPPCEGWQEMIIVPRCQSAVAIGVWDPNLRDYIIYSPRHGSGSFIESDGFQNFLEMTGKAVGLARKAAR